MQFWWYIEWPQSIQVYTLKYLRNNKDGKLISINILEYAALLTNYAASYHYCHTHPDLAEPYPLVLLYGDNAASESWMEKACNSSLVGRLLSLLQCAMMINNNVAVQTAHIAMEVNVIADSISCIKRETDSMRHFKTLIQGYPELAGCSHFQPSAELILIIMDAISQTRFINTVELNRVALTNPGKIIS